MTYRTCVGLAALLLLAPTRPCAADWPEFRGPTGQGHAEAKNLPVRWSPTDNVIWKAAIPGKGWSSPVVVDGRIYLTTAVPIPGGKPNDQSLRTLCVDAADGRILWNNEVFTQRHEETDPIHRKNSHASPTPICDGQRLFVHFGPQGTACLTTNGEIIWATRELRYRPQHGNGGSPVLVDDLLFVSCDGLADPFVAALDAGSGEIRWKRSRPPVANSRKFSFSTPLVITVRGKEQIVSPGTDRVIAYDPDTGREIWSVRYDGYSVVPRPVFAHGLVYVCTGWGPTSLLAIRPTGRGDVTRSHVAWSYRRGVSKTPSLLVVGNELYMLSDNGILTCLDAKTGRALWQNRLGGNYSASPLFADGKIYLQSEEGEGIVLRPSRRQYVELARNNLGERTLASYAVADDALFIRTDSHLYRIEAASSRR